jgi:hypothetical protein
MGQGSDGTDTLRTEAYPRSEPEEPCPYSVWDLIEVLAEPDGWALAVKNGELYIAERQQLEALGVTVKGA